MKIKCQPDDFYVEEVVDLSLAKSGAYSIYKLEKRFWDTFDLLDYLSRKYKLKNIGRAGIKDRYSHSIQYISVKGSKENKIEEDNFKLTYIGKSNTPVTLNNLVKNRFKIVVRDLNQKETEFIQDNLDSVRRYGLPNYYDEQRMGSARAQQGFIAQKLVLQHYNGALKLYLGMSSGFDDSRNRKLKKHIFEHWGNWQECLNAPYDYGQFRYPLLHLAKYPKDYKGALKTIRRDLLEIFINAYQAYIWNETLKKILEISNFNYFTKKYRFGELYFYNELTKDTLKYFQELSIPAPSYKSSFTEPELKKAMEQVLSQDNLHLSDLKIRLDIKGLFFKPYERRALIFPEDIKCDKPFEDELYPKKYKLNLSLALPKGSYATILLKRLTSL